MNCNEQARLLPEVLNGGAGLKNVDGRVKAACVVVLVVASVSAFGSHAPALTLASGAALALTIALLWRVGEPPALLMVAGLQLSQVIAPLFHANALGVPLGYFSWSEIGDLNWPTWFALGAMLSLAIGMRCGQLGEKLDSASALEREARAWSPRAAFAFCLATLVFGAIIERAGGAFESLRQLSLALSGVQYVGVFVLACVCSIQRRGFGYLMIVIGIAVAKGFTGYFSDFRQVFFVVLLGICCGRFRPRIILAGLVALCMLLALGSFWSAIKENYRAYISQGSREQVVVVSVDDQLGYVIDSAFDMDWETMAYGFDKLVKRWGYVDFLAATMHNVPDHMPFQDGAQIGATVMHVLQPRVLFPDKPPLPSDTEVLAKYTGISFGESSSEGTSVSIGYLAELYVDFGVPGAYVGMFILGFAYSRGFRLVCSFASLPTTINFGLGVMLLIPLLQFEQALAKAVGAFITTLIAILILRRFPLPRLLEVFGLIVRLKIRPGVAK